MTVSNRKSNLVINSLSEKTVRDDSYIRKAAIKHKIPYITTVTGALASAKGIMAYCESKNNKTPVLSLQEYHSSIQYYEDEE